MKRGCWLARMSWNGMMRTIKDLIEHGGFGVWKGSLNQPPISHQCFLIDGAALSGRQFSAVYSRRDL
jgi:hypothetical protein